MVLLNNALSTLLNALHEGTATTQKIFATVKMFLTKNLYTVLTIILVGFMGLPFPGQVRQLTWVTLCTASIPSLMVTFNLIRPRPVRRFQRQVLGYIMIASVIGGVSCTGAYTAAYFASGNNVDIARSVMTIVASLFGVLVFWDVHGVVPFEPVTFKQNRREATIGVIVMLIALVVPLFFPRPFQIEVLPWPYWAGILALATVDGFLLWRSNLQQTRVLDPIRALMAR
jgi:magnesium-transporting ATPase (P-type)